MKLLEFTTNEAADVLCELSPLVDNLCTDSDLLEMLGKAIVKDGRTTIGIQMEALHRVFTSAPVLFGKHRQDIFGIIAIMNRMNAESVANQPLKITLEQIRELFTDRDLIDFFSSFAG